MPEQEHTPRVFVDGDLAFVRCVCGWQSALYPVMADASDEWEAEHLAGILGTPHADED